MQSCGTDVHIPVDPPIYTVSLKTIIGHKIVGKVVKCGKTVLGLSRGDCLIMDNDIVCESWEICKKGDYNVCPNMKPIGMKYDGAFAQYLVCPDCSLIKINPNVPADRAIFAEPLNAAVSSLKKIFSPGFGKNTL